MSEKPIGKVIHYFANLGVAVLTLDAPLAVGDRIRLEGGEVNFEQTVESMQSDQQPLEKAKKGDEIGLKVDQKVRDGYRVYKVE